MQACSLRMARSVSRSIANPSRAEKAWLFGSPIRRGTNDAIFGNHSTEVENALRRIIETDGWEAVPAYALEARSKYIQWREQKFEDIRRAKQEAEEELEYLESIDFEAMEEADRAIHDRALGAIESSDDPSDYILLTPESLTSEKFGDIIRFDNEPDTFNFAGYDPDTRTLTVFDDAGRDTFYEVSENGIKEIRHDRPEESYMPFRSPDINNLVNNNNINCLF